MTAATPGCRVERLRLLRFRNYADELVEPAAGLTVLSGRNAQGKTSLLEAIATLALTRSPRGAAATELIRWGDDDAVVQARVVRPDGPTTLEMRLVRSGGDRATRTTLVDGRERPARELLGVCPVVLFSPEDLALVRGGPESRRRLLDIVLSQLDRRVATELVRYRHALEQRNALLKQVRLGAAPVGALQGFTTELTRSGGLVQVARRRLCAALAVTAAPALAGLSGGEDLSLRYVTDGVEAETDDALEATAALSAALAARDSEEIARGLTVVGPHRDEVEITLGGRPARAVASQGQQRSIVLALKLAEVAHVAAVAGMAPVLLLDDVLSELDPERRARLLAAVTTGGQVLLTTSEGGELALPGACGPVRRLVVEGWHVGEGEPGGALRRPA